VHPNLLEYFLAYTDAVFDLKAPPLLLLLGMFEEITEREREVVYVWTPPESQSQPDVTEQDKGETTGEKTSLIIVFSDNELHPDVEVKVENITKLGW